MSPTAPRRTLIAGLAGLVGLGTMLALAQLPASAASTVAVNGATTYQTIDGFGVSEAFGQANAIRTAPAATQKQALDLLFSTTNGAGFSILRSIIPSGSDSIEPTSPGSPTATPHYVWDANNAGQDQGQVWLAKQAKGYGVSTFYNDAWSAPGYMKTNGSESNGGSLCGTPGASCSSGDWRQAYANYLVQHAKYWASAGLTPTAVGFVNEPSLTTSYSSMIVSPAQAANFLAVFGPTMKASGLSTRIACCDALGFNQLPSYVSAVTGDSAANAAVGLFTSHGYSGAPTSPISSGGRPVWESEWSINGSTWTNAWDNGSETGGFTWAQRLQTAMTKANLNAFLYWWGVSNTQHDSSLIGLSGSTLTPSKRYYALANFSRFIRPGAVRISATSGNGNLVTSGYKNPDGSVVVVVLNSGSGDESTTYTLSNVGLSGGTVTPYLTNASNSTAAQSSLALGGGTFTATVPARSLVTYRITGTGPTPTPTTATPTPTTPTPTPTTPTPTTPTPTTPTPTTPSPTSAGCTAGYRTVSSWSGGFQGEVTVTAGSTGTKSWTVRWTLASGQSISQAWNATVSTSGSSVTAVNAAYNGTLGAGASTTFGFIGAGTPGSPTLTCTAG